MLLKLSGENIVKINLINRQTILVLSCESPIHLSLLAQPLNLHHTTQNETNEDKWS